MKPEKITAEMLEEKGSRCDQVEVFRKEWPGGTEVTLENTNRAAELKLDLTWFALRFLSAPASREAFEKARATAWDAYGEATFPALMAFGKAIAPASREAFDKAVATAQETFDKAIATALYETWQGTK